ncbi:MAG: ATP-binding cassette domain-containing protein [Succinatimonas hippei]|nr:ATP-binding cassette domain-containing protein [Succinatimonas hippei]
MSQNCGSIVSIRNLSFSYSGKQIYKDLTVDFPRGKITAVLGPSGTGKTTVLRLIGAQLHPDSGSVIFDGTDVNSLTRRNLYAMRKKMSMLFQSGALFQDMTVYENTAFPLEVHTDLPDEIIHDIVTMKLEAVGMRGAAGLYPAELSGGMARRAALARSIALDPELIMYDEPFVGQDPITKGVLVELIADLNVSLGLTSIVVTHDVKEIMDIADYVVILAEGSVLGQGTPDEIRNSQDPRIVQFINGDYDGPYAFHLKGAGDYLEEL